MPAMKCRHMAGIFYAIGASVHGNLTSFNPQNNESYTLGNSGGITFEDTDSSSGIRFVLPAMIVIVSPSNSSE